MTSLLKKGRDTLLNGAVLGGLLAAAVIWGSTIYEWIEGIIPVDWLILGDWSLPIYLIGVGILIGYIIDRV